MSRRAAAKELATDEDKKFLREMQEASLEQQRQREAEAKLQELQEKRRAGPPEPRAASVRAAVLADSEYLFDGLTRRLRKAAVPTHFGGVQPSMSNEPVFELEDVGVAFVILHLLHERGEVVISDWGAGGRWPAGSELLPTPRLAQRLAHLARNGLIEIRADESGGRRIGYGERARQIAARWGITIKEPSKPEEEGDDGVSVGTVPPAVEVRVVVKLAALTSVRLSTRLL